MKNIKVNCWYLTKNKQTVEIIKSNIAKTKDGFAYSILPSGACQFASVSNIGLDINPDDILSKGEFPEYYL